MATYSARRIVTRFYEHVHADGTPCVWRDDCAPDDTLNVDMAAHSVGDATHTADSVAELVAWIRQDGVRFDAYGDGVTASDPDGSQVIDYATAEREAVSWHLDGVSPRLLERVVIPAVDAP